MPKPRFIFVHGNQATHWSFAWSPWLKIELKRLGFKTFFETFPDSVIARSKYWLPFLSEKAKVAENDVIIGWSSGATAAMRYAEDHKIRGSVLVAPSYTDLGDELERQSGYFDKPWSWEKIKNNQEKIALIYGDDDPYIPQADFEHIAEKLNPEVIKVHKAGHFSEKQEIPELLKYIKQNYL